MTRAALLALAAWALAGCMDGRRWRREMEAGQAAQASGRLEEAAHHYQAALALTDSLPPEHPCVTESLDRLGAVDNALGRNAEAEPLFARSSKALERILGPRHPTLANSLHSLAEVERALGHNAQAEALYLRSISIWQSTVGPEDLTTAVGLDGLGRLYHGVGRYPEAEALYRQVIAVREKREGPRSPDLVQPLANLADVLLRTQRPDEAAATRARAQALAGR